MCSSDLGNPKTVGRQMMLHARELYGELRPIIASRTTAEWLEFCTEHSIPVGRVPTLDEVVAELPKQDHPVVGPWRVIPPPIWFSSAETPEIQAAHRIGEDTRAVLEEAGLATASIEAMFGAGAAYDPACCPPMRFRGGA